MAEAPRTLTPEGASLEALVERIRDGDEVAFQLLYQRTRRDVHRILYQLVRSNSEMEDLVQQVYLQLLSALKRFRGESKFSTFLHSVCANVGLVHLRTRRRHPEDPTDELPEGSSADGPGLDPERSAQAKQAAVLMEKALRVLTEKKRVVFVFHELLGMTAEEIGEAVGTPANTVRSRLHHARLEFAAELARLQGTSGGDR